jgi:class 3 adenylate cyclase
MSDADARQDLLDALGESIEEMALALATLGEAYELLDENSQDKLEEELFGPVQKAYGRAQRTYAGFAERRGLPNRTWAEPSPGTYSRDPRAFLERAIEAIDEAEERLIELQDSMMPVTYGDPELRAGLADVRALVAGARERSREFTRTLGR